MNFTICHIHHLFVIPPKERDVIAFIAFGAITKTRRVAANMWQRINDKKTTENYISNKVCFGSGISSHLYGCAIILNTPVPTRIGIPKMTRSLTPIT